MKGFDITFGGRTIQVATAFRTGVFIFQRHGHAHIQMSGIENCADGELISHRWIDTDFKTGDSIKIEIKDLVSSTESIETKIAFTNPVMITPEEEKIMLAENLIIFRSLERLLKQERLIPEE